MDAIGFASLVRSAGPVVVMPTTDTMLGDVDLVAVERVVRGDAPLPVLSLGERRVAGWLMLCAGFASGVVAERVGVEVRTVERWRVRGGPPVSVVRGVRRERARCGTRSGYKRHLREGVPGCVSCVEANRLYVRNRNSMV